MLVHGCTFMSISRYKNTDRLWNCVINIEKFERFNYIMKRKLFFNAPGVSRRKKGRYCGRNILQHKRPSMALARL